MKKVFPIKLEEALHRQLKHAAIDSGMSLQEWIIEVLSANINHQSVASNKKKRGYDGKPNSH